MKKLTQEERSTLKELSPRWRGHTFFWLACRASLSEARRQTPAKSESGPQPTDQTSSTGGNHAQTLLGAPWQWRESRSWRSWWLFLHPSCQRSYREPGKRKQSRPSSFLWPRLTLPATFLRPTITACRSGSSWKSYPIYHPDLGLTKDGVFPWARWVIREKGKLEVGNLGCAMCHTRLMPDGSLIEGAQGNFPFDRVIAHRIREGVV